MKKTVSYWLIALWFLVMLISYWIFLPPINIFSVAFWLFVLEGLALAFGGLALLSLGGKVQDLLLEKFCQLSALLLRRFYLFLVHQLF